MGRYAWLAAVAPAALVVAVGGYLLARRKISPEERERRRRLMVNAVGRITDGIITDVLVIENPNGAASHLIHFHYELHGVTYTAAQDVTALMERLARQPERIAGPASVKYLPANPSNSIVICEEWSGLR